MLPPIHKIDLNNYCTMRTAPHAAPNLLVSPKQEGRELVVQYYEKKYGTNITFPMEPQEDIADHEISPDYALYVDFINDPTEYIEPIRKLAFSRDGDYRHTIYIGARNEHAIPFIYIKENGEEAILFANSIETTKLSIECMASAIYEDGKKIPLYVVEEIRQQDRYSCFSDALVFGRDCTAINTETGEYYIPALLQELKSRCEEKTLGEETYFKVKLPEQLLKTAQISEFVETHRQKDAEGNHLHPAPQIHKGKTLDEFRKQHTQMITKTTTNKVGEKIVQVKGISSYLREKGVKFTDMMEIQFYLNQINNLVDGGLSAGIKNQFITEAKRELKQQLDDYLQNNTGQLGPTEHYFQSRDGLYELANKFANSIMGNGLMRKSNS